MIQKIQSIKDFGVFSNFRWPADLPNFKHCNLIYGWNYSGKTTLSRIFRCFEQKQAHGDFLPAQVQLAGADGTTFHLSAPQNSPVFRVFNTDFIRENLFFDAGSAAPILVLGAEDIARQTLLTAKKADRDKLIAAKEGSEKSKSSKEIALERALTRYARDFIKTPLNAINYDKRKFEPNVKQCKSSPEKYILADSTLAECLAAYRSNDKKQPLTAKNNSLTTFASIQSKAESMLAKAVTATNPIPRLTENPYLERWVNEGRPLHQGKDQCQFCNNALPADLLQQLSAHFSAEYDTLMKKLSELLTEIADAGSEAIALEDKGDFYPELVAQYAENKRPFNIAMKSRKTALETLEKAVKNKQVMAFSAVECPTIGDADEKVTDALNEINQRISAHNTRTAEFEKKREETFTRIEQHYAAKFVQDEKYNEEIKSVADIAKVIEEQIKTLGELDSDIRGLEKELSKAAKGAERINDLLSAYFGKSDLQIQVSADERFQIVRAGVLAKNLSEGEKTAIAFAHFITRVQDGRHPIEDTRIVIDDPISSLDANHLFNTYALIKTQLFGCRQLFISTHSFEFYNLIREWVSEDEKDLKKPQSQWKKWGIFMVRRNDNGESVLEEIPKELLRFKSEYHYLFSILYNFDVATAGQFDGLFTLPNVTRRFMEAFGGLMIPRWAGLRGKMDKLFPDIVERERVWKFINQYSHNTTITRSLTIPDTSECRAVVKSCLKAVRDWDADYFADLEAEVT